MNHKLAFIFGVGFGTMTWVGVHLVLHHMENQRPINEVKRDQFLLNNSP